MEESVAATDLRDAWTTQESCNQNSSWRALLGPRRSLGRRIRKYTTTGCRKTQTHSPLRDLPFAVWRHSQTILIMHVYGESHRSSTMRLNRTDSTSADDSYLTASPSRHWGKSQESRVTSIAWHSTRHRRTCRYSGVVQAFCFRCHQWTDLWGILQHAPRSWTTYE